MVLGLGGKGDWWGSVFWHGGVLGYGGSSRVGGGVEGHKILGASIFRVNIFFTKISGHVLLIHLHAHYHLDFPKPTMRGGASET